MSRKLEILCNHLIYLLLQLYEIDDNPKRKEFLDELFTMMQKRGKINCVCFEYNQASEEFLLLFKILSWTGWECYLNYFGVLCVVLLDEDYSKPAKGFLCSCALMRVSTVSLPIIGVMKFDTHFLPRFYKKNASSVSDCYSAINI